MKFRLGFFPFCCACLLVKFTVCLANLGALVQEVKWSQHLIKANLVGWDNRSCILKSMSYFTVPPASFCIAHTQRTHTRQVSLRLPLVCLIRPICGFCLLLCGTKEKVIHISQILHPSLWEHLLYSGLISSPSVERTVLLKWCSSSALFIQSQNSWDWKGLLDIF